jgi:hypothetical protein
LLPVALDDEEEEEEEDDEVPPIGEVCGVWI